MQLVRASRVQIVNLQIFPFLQLPSIFAGRSGRIRIELQPLRGTERKPTPTRRVRMFLRNRRQFGRLSLKIERHLTMMILDGL